MRSEVYNIDCMEYMRSLPNKAFDLAIVDPPKETHLLRDYEIREREVR